MSKYFDGEKLSGYEESPETTTTNLMSRTKLTCVGCGREIGLGEMVSTDGVLWRCKECSTKHNEEYCNKDAKIAELEEKLAESEKDRLMWQEMYKSADRLNKGICETDIYPLQEENTQLKQQLAEKENSVVLKPDKYVIVTNGWKKQGYGIAKIHQEVRDVYYYCSNNRIGSFSPLTQYGEFETFEEAEVKLKELKGKKK